MDGMSLMEDASVILDSHRTMAISTVRPDGWPQTTIVGYANVSLTLYFLIFRSGQKFANIQHDNRISIAVGEEPRYLRDAKAVYSGARATEVTDPKLREAAWSLLMQRHPNLAEYVLPESADAAMMRADCQYLSVLDYTKGFGNTKAFSIATGDAQTGGITQ